jgi:ribosomal protein S18 acetylase RimI-like enzyme
MEATVGQGRAPIVVRQATLDDARAIARVHVAAWRSAYRGQMPDAVLDAVDEEQRASLWHRLLQAPDHAVVVAVRDQSVIGFCSVVASRDADAGSGTGEVPAIYVAPESWRSGAGRALMSTSIAAAQQRGYRALTLWVLDSNARAQAFYERLGLAPDGASKLESRGDHSLHEVRYRLELERRDDAGRR